MTGSPLPRENLADLIVFEDAHLLVVNKPAGINTHAPGPFAGEGLYDWLRHRELRWASLAIIHRLDKETSGLLLFSKTALANRSLTEQFTQRQVRKEYVLLTDRAVPAKPLTVRTHLERAGDRYVSRTHAQGDLAETRFRKMRETGQGAWVVAEPITGRTHQIRVHAAESGFPVLGDTLYGGTPAARVFLHAQSITLAHPATGQRLAFEALPDFDTDARLKLRRALVDSEVTTAFRLIHGAADGWPDLYVDRLGEFLLAQSERPLSQAQVQRIEACSRDWNIRGVFHKTLLRQIRAATPSAITPKLILGEAPAAEFVVRENGVEFLLSFQEGYSIGLFLDQRDNRRRLLTRHVAAQFDLGSQTSAALDILNVFAYTCAFSVCAARAGGRTTSLDLSKKYLDWGRRNFAQNGIDPAAHDFIYGDALDWMSRLARKNRQFDLVLLDPPTFSRSKTQGTFQATRDYAKLASAAVALLKPEGVLFASTNAAELKPERFLEMIEDGIKQAGRKIAQQQFYPQPPDFPITRAEPGYLKTVWMRVAAAR